jgi:hypothetical protein
MSIHANMLTSIDELRAAAYLNNIAVSLIQTRRSYLLKGMKTLSDAISIIKKDAPYEEDAWLYPRVSSSLSMP